MSTFMPEIHGKPESLLVEIWKGEGVRVTYNSEIVCQGRSVNDLLKSITQFLELVGIPVTITPRDTP